MASYPTGSGSPLSVTMASAVKRTLPEGATMRPQELPYPSVKKVTGAYGSTRSSSGLINVVRRSGRSDNMRVIGAATGTLKVRS